MDEELDNKDIKILECLRMHGRWSVQKISKHTQIPITTVHHRMKKMERNGVIKNYSVRVDHKKAGLPLAAYVLIHVNISELRANGINQSELAKRLIRVQGVRSAATVTGLTDCVIKVRAKDLEELDKIVAIDLRNIGGIDRTETLVILKEADEDIIK